MWPFSKDAEGHLKLTGQASGYEGGPYDALGVFDKYRKTYGVRKVR
jgi:hypothetical protein